MSKDEILRSLARAEAKIMRMKRRLKAKRNAMPPEQVDATRLGIQQFRDLCASYRVRLREIDGHHGQTR